jgi:pimeloyl-ACP methyl ester carboxylesterase
LQLKPTVDLQWTRCFEDFTCTILEVPLDYSDEDAGTTGIAFIKWTSPNATTSAQDILVNPGGPGGSGVQFVRSGLGLLQEQFGTSNNIVGFDPRGVNNSGPDLSCFPGQKDTARLYDPDFGKAVDVNSSLSLLITWAQAGAFGQWCSDVHGPDSPSKYANTIATATDMLHYVELAAEANKEQKEDAKLYYYGASYGTVLGSTFATLFPDRVGRMILDGVVDGEDYFEGRWAANLFDADAAVESFFQYCYDGGASVCAFWDESPAAIQTRFEAVFADIAANPIIVDDRSVVKTPNIITISDLKSAITVVPYSPVVYFPFLAEIMLELEQRNGSTFATTFGAGATLDECAPDNVSNAQQIEPRYYIACNDADRRTNYSTVESWTEYADHLAKQSKYLGEAWAAATSLECRSLQVYPPESQVLSGTPSASNTSTPILFIGNTLDPVTPLRGAKKMSGLFGGSRVLTQNSVGHCSSAALSSCTMEYMQKYLATGSLPEEGTVCESEQVPFKDEVTESQDATVSMRKRHYVQR